MEKNTAWILGLDISTGAIGWAAADPAGTVLEKDKKTLWGTRFTDAGMTAAEERDSGQAMIPILRQASEIAQELRYILQSSPDRIFLGGTVPPDILRTGADILWKEFPGTEIVPAGKAEVRTADLLQQLRRRKGLTTRYTPGQLDNASPEDAEEYGKQHPEAAAYFLYAAAQPAGSSRGREYMFIPVPISLAAEICAGEETGGRMQRESCRKALLAYCREVWKKEGKEYERAEILRENVPCNALLATDQFRMYISPESGTQQVLIEAVARRLRAQREIGAGKIAAVLASAKGEGETPPSKYDRWTGRRRTAPEDLSLCPILRDCGDDVLPQAEKDLLEKGEEMYSRLNEEEKGKVFRSMIRIEDAVKELVRLQQFCRNLPKKKGQPGETAHPEVIRLPFRAEERPAVGIICRSASGFYEKSAFLRPFGPLYGHSGYFAEQPDREAEQDRADFGEK